MNFGVLLSATGMLAILASAGAVSPRERTDSGQFTIYSHILSGHRNCGRHSKCARIDAPKTQAGSCWI